MKDFVPYQEALELEQLGFDEPCLGWYLPEIVEKGNIPSVILGAYLTNWTKFGGRLSAPTFSQAFRWFREKYNLNHVITVADFGKYESGNPDFQCAIYSKDPLLITNMYKYNTYEEAELACLQKLIELVKK